MAGCDKGMALADQRRTTSWRDQFFYSGPSHCPLVSKHRFFHWPPAYTSPRSVFAVQSHFERNRARLAAGRNQRLPFHLEAVAQIESKFTAPCKSVLAVAPVPDDPSRIEPGSARGFPLTKILERGFRSDRKRSNIVPRQTATGRPPLLA
jgi:hypothetical protein